MITELYPIYVGDISTYVLIDGGVVGSDVNGFLDRFTRLCLSLSTMLKFFNVLWPE